MKTWCIAAVSLWLISCATTTSKATPTAVADEWTDVMRQLDAACLDLDAWLLQGASGDLQAVAGRAQAAAERVRLGYGGLDYQAVPGFARMSRDCESWFLQIALEARQGLGGIAADIYRSGRQQHCNRCHDAFEASK